MRSTATMAEAQPIQRPNSLELPLYVNADKMREWVEAAVDPIPHIRLGAKGGKRLIRTAAIPEYLRRKETR